MTVLMSVALIVLLLLLSIFFKQLFINDVIKHSIQDQVNLLGDIYTKKVWDRYFPVINYINERPAAERATFSQYLTFVSETNSFLTSTNLIKTYIYNKKGEKIFESNPQIKLVEKNTYLANFINGNEVSIPQMLTIEKATKSTYLSNVFIVDGTENKRVSIIKVFIPISVTQFTKDSAKDASSAIGIMEFNYDISASVRSIDMLQYGLVITFALCLSLILLSIVLGSKKAEQFIEKQQELGLELAAARSSAEADNKSKSQFLANITHELRTPLNAIIGFSEIISSESMGPINNVQYKEFINDIHTSGIHLLSLINDVLDFSKAEANKLEVVIEEMDLTKIAAICIRMITPRAEEAQVKLIQELPAEHIIVKLDSKRIKQVILNLLSNAVKFTPKNGNIILKMVKDTGKKEVMISVIDNGIGMASQDLSQALASFGQVDSKLSRKREGTGLGLPLTKKLIELMKGKLDIKSEIGLGTTVTITFPFAEEDVPHASEEIVAVPTEQS